MDIDKLIPRVVAYLRDVGVLDGKPKMGAIRLEREVFDPRGEWEEYEGTGIFDRTVPVNFHRGDFERIDADLTRTTPDGALDIMLEEIPNSADTVVIDVGSWYGYDLGGFIAQEKPEARVVLADKGWKEKNPPRFLFDPKIRRRVQFDTGKELLDEPNLAKRINGLYHANGIENVQFVHTKLEFDKYDWMSDGKPVDLRGNVYVVGERLTGDLPLIAAIMYKALEGKMLMISEANRGKVRNNSDIWWFMQKNLGISEEEVAGYRTSVKKGFESKVKFDYHLDEQRRVGMMAKLGISLALAKEVGGDVLRINKLREDYSRPDHYVLARN